MSTVHDTTSGMANLRDLGGLPTSSGATTRHGVLYRGDAPRWGDVSATGLLWPPATVLDLREPTELRGTTHPLAAAGTVVHHLPLLNRDQLDTALTGSDATHTPQLPALYELLLHTGAGAIVRILEHAATAVGPVLVHCAAGKDRTGVTIAVLLAAAGVRRDVIVHDYTRTERNLAELYRRLDTAVLPPTWRDSSGATQLMAAPAAAIAAVLDQLEDHNGGVYGWLRAHGATPNTISAWRRRILRHPARHPQARATLA